MIWAVCHGHGSTIVSIVKRFNQKSRTYCIVTLILTLPNSEKRFSFRQMLHFKKPKVPVMAVTYASFLQTIYDANGQTFKSCVNFGTAFTTIINKTDSNKFSYYSLPPIIQY